MSEFFTCEQVAERYGVKVFAVREWIKLGKLRAIKLAGKNYRIRSEDLADFEKEYETGKGGEISDDD
jgi:excisionase family DNA binding protein